MPCFYQARIRDHKIWTKFKKSVQATTGPYIIKIVPNMLKMMNIGTQTHTQKVIDWISTLWRRVVRFPRPTSYLMYKISISPRSQLNHQLKLWHNLLFRVLEVQLLQLPLLSLISLQKLKLQQEPLALVTLQLLNLWPPFHLFKHQ